jgi:CBS domain-containing protein
MWDDDGGLKEVAEVMTRAVVAADQMETLGEIRELMSSNALRSVPVLDPEGHPVGVVSLGDLIDGHKDDALISAVMTKDVVMIGPENSVAEAASQMLLNYVHHLVVVDDRMRAIGVVSALDLLGEVAELADR